MADDRPVQHFPDSYSIKAVGKDEGEFAEHVLGIVRAVLGEDTALDYRTRPSRNGAYVSVTVSFTATSQQQLDDVFREVSADPRIVWVL